MPGVDFNDIVLSKFLPMTTRNLTRPQHLRPTPETAVEKFINIKSNHLSTTLSVTSTFENRTHTHTHSHVQNLVKFYPNEPHRMETAKCEPRGWTFGVKSEGKYIKQTTPAARTRRWKVKIELSTSLVQAKRRLGPVKRALQI